MLRHGDAGREGDGETGRYGDAGRSETRRNKNNGQREIENKTQ
jgi:hypothetical protein